MSLCPNRGFSVTENLANRRWSCHLFGFSYTDVEETRCLLPSSETTDSGFSKFNLGPLSQSSGKVRKSRPCPRERLLCNRRLVSTAVLHQDRQWSRTSAWIGTISDKMYARNSHLLDETSEKGTSLREEKNSESDSSLQLEIFKGEQSPKDALHSKFNVFDGSEVEGADEVGQLQICAVSIYLLTLVQMITSNLQVDSTKNKASIDDDWSISSDDLLDRWGEFRAATSLLHRTSLSYTWLRHLGTRQ